MSSTCFERRVHRQEDYIVHAVFCGVFFMHLCKQSSCWKDGNIGDRGWPMAKSCSRNSLHCNVLNASPTEQRLLICLYKLR